MLLQKPWLERQNYNDPEKQYAYTYIQPWRSSNPPTISNSQSHTKTHDLTIQIPPDILKNAKNANSYPQADRHAPVRSQAETALYASNPNKAQNQHAKACCRKAGKAQDQHAETQVDGTLRPQAEAALHSSRAQRMGSQGSRSQGTEYLHAYVLLDIF